MESELNDKDLIFKAKENIGHILIDVEEGKMSSGEAFLLLENYFDKLSPQIVLLERKESLHEKYPHLTSNSIYFEAIGWNACLDEVKRLNKQAKALPSLGYDELITLLAQAYCLPQHSTEILNVHLIQDQAKAILARLEGGE